MRLLATAPVGYASLDTESGRGCTSLIPVLLNSVRKRLKTFKISPPHTIKNFIKMDIYTRLGQGRGGTNTYSTLKDSHIIFIF